MTIKSGHGYLKLPKMQPKHGQSEFILTSISQFYYCKNHKLSSSTKGRKSAQVPLWFSGQPNIMFEGENHKIVLPDYANMIRGTTYMSVGYQVEYYCILCSLIRYLLPISLQKHLLNQFFITTCDIFTHFSPPVRFWRQCTLLKLDHQIKCIHMNYEAT